MEALSQNVDGSCNATVLQGNGFQAGVGGLGNFEATLTANLYVPTAGNTTFQIWGDDGWIFGSGQVQGGTAQPTYVSGTLNNPPASTPLKGYPVVAAWNTTAGGGSVTINFPVAGVYPIEIDYTECCGDGLGLTLENANGQAIPQRGFPAVGPAESFGSNGGSDGLENSSACSATHNPVNCATGNFTHTFTDLSIPGRGIPLLLSRTYNSLNAGNEGLFGYGWSSSYETSLSLNAFGDATITQEDGSQATFLSNGSGGFTAPARVLGALVQNPDGTFTLTRRGRETLTFSAGGQLTAETDLNGYKTTLAYNGSGQLTTVTDPAGRALTFAYGANGLVSSVTDSAGRTVSYFYDSSGNLTSVKDANGGITTFAYDSNHLLLTMTDARNDGSVTNVYDAFGRVTQQTDPMNRVTKFSYSTVSGTNSWSTTITDPNNNQTVESYTNGILTSLTKAYGTSSAATWTYGFDPTLGVSSVTDPNQHTWTYQYDANGNQTLAKDPLGNTIHRTFNSFDEPTSITDQNNVTTTYSYDASGNLQSVSRPLVATGQTQQTTYTYGDLSHPGDVTAITDPNSNKTTLTYDTYGDLASSTDAAGDQTTYSYSCSGTPAQGCFSNIGLLYAEVSPRGNAAGANPASFTTSYSYNAFGEPLTVTDPLGHTTTYQYDADGNQTQVKDPDGNLTGYVYDADNELTQTNRADGTTLQTGYDGDGNVTSQTNGNNQTTGYQYTPLNEVSKVTDPLTRSTVYNYDLAGRLTSMVDPANRTTSYGYDAANELTSISYSDGVTPNVSYSYYPNGQRKAMTDGTGTTSYSYDSLDRLTGQTNGDGQAVGYGYDLANNLTSLTYPNGKTVTRSYNHAEQLQSITDWLGNKTSLGYDPDSDQTSTTFPSSTGNVDSYGYNNADQLTQIGIAQGASTLASFNYTRDNNGQLASVTPTGVNQSNETYGYTQLNQLKSVNNTNYVYDAADDPTQIGSTSLTYDNANQIKTLTANGLTTNFSYDQLGERTQGGTSPSAASTYAYDQAQRLTKVSSASAGGVVAGGNAHGLFLKADGTVWATGSNKYGQLGNTSVKTSTTTPVQVSNLTGVVAISAGVSPNGSGNSSYALKSDGTVWAWGDNTYGQLGNGTTTKAATPIQVSNLSGVVAIGSNGEDAYAVKSNGTVWAWGSNTYGQLGNGTTTSSTTAVQVSNLSGITSIGVGGYHALAVKSDGTVWAWGNNAGGELGNGTNNNQYDTPIQVPGLTGITQVAAGGYFSLALTSAGTMWAWGVNPFGELGTGSSYPSGSVNPVQVPNFSGVTAIAALSDSSMALKSDGTVWEWGYNAYGELGNGTTTNETSPVQVSGITNAVAIGTGGFSSYAGKSDGTAWAWGYNKDGELGNGTTKNSSTPVSTGLTGLPASGSAAAYTYTYDGDGLRASSSLAGQAQHYAWDVSGSTPTLLTDGATSYIYDDNGLPVEQIDSSGNVLYYHHDQLGSTRVLTSSTGASAATYTYDASGNLTNQTGTANTPLRWAGQYQDPTGLYYMQARYYDPTTSQFVTVDPLVAQTRQPYRYANDNPINNTDPTGESANFWCAPGLADYPACTSGGPSWTDIGLAAGGLSFATGIGELVVGSETVAGALGAASFGSGTLATAIDLHECVVSRRASSSCAAGGLGLAGTGAGAVALTSRIGQTVAGGKAIGLSSGLTASLADGAGTLADQETTSQPGSDCNLGLPTSVTLGTGGQPMPVGAAGRTYR